MKKRTLKLVVGFILSGVALVALWVDYCVPATTAPAFPRGAPRSDVAETVRQQSQMIFHEYGSYPRIGDNNLRGYHNELKNDQRIRPVESYRNLYAYVHVWSFRAWTKRFICGCKVATERPARYFGFFYRGPKKPPLVMLASDADEGRPSQEAWGNVVRYVEEGDNGTLADLIRFDGLDPDRDSRLWRWAVRRAEEKRIERLVPALLDNLERRYANNDYSVDYYVERLIEALVQIRGEGREIRSGMTRGEKRDVVKWWLRHER